MNSIVNKAIKNGLIGVAGVVGGVLFTAAAEGAVDTYEKNKNDAPETEPEIEKETETKTKKTEKK